MAALIESDKPSAGQVSSESLPIPGVGAQAVEKEDSRLSRGVRFRNPLQVVEADSISNKPTVDRCAHRR